MEGSESIKAARHCPRCWNIKMPMWRQQERHITAIMKQETKWGIIHTQSTPDLTLGIGVRGKASHGNRLWSKEKGLREGKIKNTPNSELNTYASILNWLQSWVRFFPLSLSLRKRITEQIMMFFWIIITLKIRQLDWKIPIVFLSCKIPFMPDHLPNGPKTPLHKSLGFLRMKEVFVPTQHENLVLIDKTSHKQQFSSVGNSPTLCQ